MTIPALQNEFNYFKENQDQLVSAYEGRFILIKDCAVVGDFDTELEAYTEGKSKYELGTFLIQHCVPGSESYTQTFHSRVVAQ